MKWSDIGSLVAKAAPIVGTLLGGPAGTAVGTLVASVLGTNAQPDAVAAVLKNDPAALTRIKQMQMDHEAELFRMHLAAETARLNQVNQTMRLEIASTDGYVRRWRPTFGYLTALAWLVQCTAIAWTLVATPSQAGSVAQAITALTPMWGIALAVLGVSVSKRSTDKQVAGGQQPTVGLLSALVQKINK